MKTGEKIDKILEVVTRHDERLTMIRTDVDEIKSRVEKNSQVFRDIESLSLPEQTPFMKFVMASSETTTWAQNFKIQVALVVGFLSLLWTVIWAWVKANFIDK